MTTLHTSDLICTLTTVKPIIAFIRRATVVLGVQMVIGELAPITAAAGPLNTSLSVWTAIAVLGVGFRVWVACW